MSKDPKICVICGEEYIPFTRRDRTCRAPKCVKAHSNNCKNGRPANPKLKCAECGKEFVQRFGRVTCSDECQEIRHRRHVREARARMVERRKNGVAYQAPPPVMYESAVVKPEHVCCDCGTPTANRRCTPCLEKWQTKHGVHRGADTSQDW